jgi:sugar lactone lactonase YvrE
MRSRYTRAFVGTGCVTALFVVSASAAAAAPGGGAAVAVVAGTGAMGGTGEGGGAAHVQLASPSGIAVDAAGDVAVADTGNCRVEMIAARSGRHFGIAMKAGHLYTVAGTGCGSPGKDHSSSVGYPTGVAFDEAGDLLIADASGNRVVELAAASGRDFGVPVTAGHLTTVAGTGVAGTAKDEQAARTSRLDDPEGIAVDRSGNLYIADTAACQVDEVAAHDGTQSGVSLEAGHLYLVAGTGVCGYGGDGGRAVMAELWSPSAVAVDAGGDILIADEGNSAVREVPATTGTFFGVAIAAGDIATVAGQDMYVEYLNDGLGASGPASSLNYPTGLTVDSAGDLVIADSFDRCIREVPAHNGVFFGRSEDADDMYTLAGILPVGGAAAGDATRWIMTRVTYPYGVAFGPGGALYFSDQGANTVRRVTSS